MSRQHEVFILFYEHKSGSDLSAYGSQAKLQAALVDIVRSQWSDRADQSAPDDSTLLDDAAAVEAYFFDNEEEFFRIEAILVPFEDEADDLSPSVMTDRDDDVAETRPMRWVSVRPAWPNTWTFGVSIATAEDRTGCVMVHVGRWVLIVGPHWSRGSRR